MRHAILLMLVVAGSGDAAAPAPVAASPGAPRQVQQPPATDRSQQPVPPGDKPPPPLSNEIGTWPFIKWTQVRDGDIFKSYAGLPTRFRSGDRVTMWHLYDFKQAQNFEGWSFLSKQGKNEYDCGDRRSRVIAYSLYSGNMGDGNVVFLSYGMDNPWEPVEASNVSETLWKFACSNRY